LRQLVAPFEKHGARTWIGQRLDWKVTETLLNAFDLLDVVAAGTFLDPVLEFGALLKAE
jgi:hypothetical protein